MSYVDYDLVVTASFNKLHSSSWSYLIYVVPVLSEADSAELKIFRFVFGVFFLSCNDLIFWKFKAIKLTRRNKKKKSKNKQIIFNSKKEFGKLVNKCVSNNTVSSLSIVVLYRFIYYKKIRSNRALKQDVCLCVYSRYFIQEES